jgi:hypothetical protein
MTTDRWAPIPTWSLACVLPTLLGFFLFTTIAVQAQLEMPVPLVLDASSAEDRQIIGLADPVTSDAAISLRALRNNTASTATVSGTVALVGTLTPAPVSYTAGMSVQLIPGQANAAGATLELNGLGALAIVKRGGLPLDSADLLPGVPALVIHDGSNFQLISSTSLPCPPGFTPSTRDFCVADSSRAAATWFEASAYCTERGTRLCTISEWTHACVHAPGFIGTVISAEWVDHAANNINGAKLVGAGSDGVGGVPGVNCRYGGQSPPENPFRFRCCTHR